MKNNIYDDYNIVTDIDSHGGTPDNDRYGNHSIIHGTGVAGSVILNRVGTPSYENKFAGLFSLRGNPLDPLFTDDNSSSGDGTGDGDYHLLSASPAIGLVPSGGALLPFDLDGVARDDTGNGASGAFEKVGAIPLFIHYYYQLRRG